MTFMVFAGAGNYRLVIQSASGNGVAEFKDNGVVNFEGDCTYGGICTCVGNCWKVENSLGDLVFYVDESGNACWEGYAFGENYGAFFDLGLVCTVNSVLIQDASGTLEACIDSVGNLYARGEISCQASVS